MFEIQEPGLLRGLRESFNLQAPSGFTLDRIVSPVAVVRDLTAGPQETGYGVTIRDVPAAVGVRAAAVFTNGSLVGGTDPTVFCRVLSVYVAALADNRFVSCQLQGITGSPAVGSFSGRPLYPVASPSGRSQARLTGDDGGTLTNEFYSQRTGFEADGVTIVFPGQGLILPPGRSVKFVIGATNENMRTCSVFWTEFRRVA